MTTLPAAQAAGSAGRHRLGRVCGGEGRLAPPPAPPAATGPPCTSAVGCFRGAPLPCYLQTHKIQGGVRTGRAPAPCAPLGGRSNGSKGRPRSTLLTEGGWGRGLRPPTPQAPGDTQEEDGGKTLSRTWRGGGGGPANLTYYSGERRQHNPAHPGGGGGRPCP